jgi:hypothetical protein
MSYKLLINKSFDEFIFKEEFVEEVFKKYPPNTDIGEKLFTIVDTKKLNDIPLWAYNKKTLLGKPEIPFIDGYRRLVYTFVENKKKNPAYTNYETKFIKDIETDEYYSLEGINSWRGNKNIIALAEKYGLNECSTEGNVCTINIPKGFAYDIRLQTKHIEGLEMTAKLSIKEIICVTLPYEEIINDMIDFHQDKLVNYSDISLQLIKGEKTLDDLKACTKIISSDGYCDNNSDSD